MHRRPAALCWLCVGLLFTAGMACARKTAVTSTSVEDLAEQLEELRERVDTVRETRDRLRAEIRESPELAPLREAMDRADAAYQSRKETDYTYVAAVKAEEDARDKLQELRGKLEEDDLDVWVAREILKAASKARREAYESEALSSWRKARDAARAAYDAKVRELEEANAELAAAVKEREELRTRVAELEKRIREQPPSGAGAGRRGGLFTAGPYLTGLGPDRVTVSWETTQATAGRVEYYVRPNQHQFANSELKSQFHRVSITGLPPATECWYRVHAGAEATPFSRFRTAPHGATPFRFAVYGDSRSNPRYHARIARAILKHQPAFVVHTGDLVGNGRDPRQWEPEFFTPARELLRECPILPAMGTHDGNSPLFHRYFGLTEDPLPLEQQLGDSPPEHLAPAWFAWAYGDVALFVLNTYAPLAPGTPQLRWLDESLAASRARWRIVVCHKPIYSSGKHGGSKSLRWNILPLLLKHGVDMLFVGHDHIYERTHAIGSGSPPEGSALVEIVTGGGGAPLYRVKPGTWTAHASSRRNYCVVAVEEDRLAVTAHGDRGEAFDHVVLRKRGDRREFGETISATALELLQSAERFAGFSFPHVQSGVRTREFSFTVRNPYADELHGELSWEIFNKAWSVDPPRQSIRVPPGKSGRVAFTAEFTPPSDGSTVEPVPQAVIVAGGRKVATRAFAIERPPSPRAASPHLLRNLTCAGLPTLCRGMRSRTLRGETRWRIAE